VVGGLGFILTGLRAGVRTNSEDIKANGERIGRLEAAFGRFEERTISEFGHVKDVLARIEATQADHGRMLKDHGRLLETHSHQLADHGRMLKDQGRLLETHSHQLADHGRMLKDHGRLLETHSHQLADHGRLLEKLAGDDAS